MKLLFNGHSDYQTKVYSPDDGADFWVVRYRREKDNRLKTVARARRDGWAERRIDFSPLSFLSPPLLEKFKAIVQAIAMKNVPETVYIYQRGAMMALCFLNERSLIRPEDKHIASSIVLAMWDSFSERQREMLRVLNNYDAYEFYDRDISTLLPASKADNYGKRFRSIISPETGTLTQKEAVRLLLGARNALDSGLIDIKDAVLLFLVYEAGQRISSFSSLRWADFYCLDMEDGVRWYLDLAARKGAVEKITQRISNTSATLLRGYFQLFEKHARRMGVEGDLSHYPIFIRSSLTGELFMSSLEHDYSWDSAVGQERLSMRLNEIMQRLRIPNRTGASLTFNSNRARHTGATFRTCEGASVLEVQQFLRHRTPFVAQVYVDVSSTEVADLIDEAFEGIFQAARDSAMKATARPKEIDLSKVVTFYNPSAREIEMGGVCGYEKRCGDAPFACVTGCDKFQPFMDAPFSVLLETLKKEFNDYLESTSSTALVSEYHEAIAALEAFVREIDVVGNFGEE